MDRRKFKTKARPVEKEVINPKLINYQKRFKSMADEFINAATYREDEEEEEKPKDTRYRVKSVRRRAYLTKEKARQTIGKTKPMKAFENRKRTYGYDPVSRMKAKRYMAKGETKKAEETVNKSYKKFIKKRMYRRAYYEGGSNSPLITYMHYKSLKRKANKKATKEINNTIKSAIGGFLGSFLGVITIFVISISIVAFAIYLLMGLVQALVNPNDIGTLTNTSESVSGLMSDYEYYLRDPEGIKETKRQIEEYKFPGITIDEWVFDVPDDYSYDMHLFAAYFAQKYGEYEASMVTSEIEEIIGKLFDINVYIEEVEYEVYEVIGTDEEGIDIWDYVRHIKRICHVEVTRNNLEEIIGDMVTDAGRYEAYLESGNGQQGYGPIIEADWYITSPFGHRTAPSTNQGTGSSNHKGVDLRAAVGTAIYSPFTGTVTASSSTKGGYMLSITNESGYKITFMHLSSNNVVANGSEINKGELVALSGNTGNSSGPHIHVQMQDESGNYLDPTFYIPQHVTN